MHSGGPNKRNGAGIFFKVRIQFPCVKLNSIVLNRSFIFLYQMVKALLSLGHYSKLGKWGEIAIVENTTLLSGGSK